METKWTKSQQAAINAREADILVAAAAGSGKTAVLVERIIERITDREQPVDLDRLLVVTFTNAAAAEMRQRIGAALSKKLEQEPENQLLLRQLALLPNAPITTIHAYCHKVLRANFDSLGLDPNFRIADPTENELMRLAALEEVIEAMYDDETYAEDFLHLTEAYLHIKNPDPFYKLVNHIYDFAMSLPNPKGWLDEAASRFDTAEDFTQTPYAEQLLSIGKCRVQGIIEKYDAMLYLAEEDDGGEAFYQLLYAEREAFVSLYSSADYDAFYQKLMAFGFDTIPRVPKDAQPRYRDGIRAVRDGVKNVDMKKMREELFCLSEQDQKEILLKLHPLMRCLSELVKRLMDRFDEKKAAKNLLNYNDLEHGCHRLFVDDIGQPTAVALAEQQRYDEILIDEYQDTSALQEAIFGAIKKEGGLFLVGDVKQSIYGFRNTNPKLFREKKETYGHEPDAPKRKILLSQNFRSRSHVLDAINFIFKRVMSAGTGEIEYNEEEMLYPGAVYPEMERPLSFETELWLAELKGQADEEESLNVIEAEAIMAAGRITELMESGYQVLDKNGVRPLTYRDICILMRSVKNTAAIFCKVLSERGIPCYSDAGSSFLQSQEITVMMSLLKIIDNPHQDIPLLSVLRSQLYALSTDELAEIRLANRKTDLFDALCQRAKEQDALGKKLATFLSSLSVYREKSRILDTAELVWYLYMETGFYEAQSTLSGGALRRLNLRLLYTRAAAFEKTGLKGLYNFIRFVDEYQSIGGDYDGARTIGEEQDVVRVMSIHKSKGLEFPVVILAGMNRGINMLDIKEKVLIHSEWGYGPKYIDTELGLVYNNGAQQVVRHAMLKETLSEEMRILYVAMTRAREKLIMLGAGHNLEERIKKFAVGAEGEQVSVAFTAAATSYLDWIFMALYAHPDAELLRKKAEAERFKLSNDSSRFRIEWLEADSLFTEEEPIAEDEKEEKVKETGSLPAMLQYQYPYQDEGQLPAKLTVTELKRKSGGEEDTVYLYPRPIFLMERSGRLRGAEAGTALHTFLEHLQFENCDSLASVTKQIDNLLKRGILTQAEAESIPAHKVLIFMQSELGCRLSAAKQVLREVRFGIQTDAEPFFHVKGKVMLQGMMDCVLFEDEGISIIDYKTDRSKTPQELKEHYRIQLDCYKEAAEKMYGQKVVHRYLYLFHYDTFIEL
ncbi:MAG: helicase-exonuclease AddAB subunit AddA [Clostridia bacterium]|nr:helicase-exonuclease AddAB subunit AddA [Clostridia bacterium]